ncbi:MAG: hypothetical protein MHMPM18_004241 [Marteilia pararefringens]
MEIPVSRKVKIVKRNSDDSMNLDTELSIAQYSDKVEQICENQRFIWRMTFDEFLRTLDVMNIKYVVLK